MNKKLIEMLLGLYVAACLASSAVAADDSKKPTVSEVVEDTVTVQSVDVSKRLLTVKKSDGEVQTLEVPASIKNFPQLKAGDQITARFKVAVAAAIRKPGDTSVTTEAHETAATTPPGSKPGGMAQRTVKTVITVKAIDTTNNILTFVGPKGITREVAVKDPEMQNLLKQLKPGDKVGIDYTEALAIEVKPVKQ